MCVCVSYIKMYNTYVYSTIEPNIIKYLPFRQSSNMLPSSYTAVFVLASSFPLQLGQKTDTVVLL